MDVSFAELDGDPLGTLRRIYAELGLDGYEAARPAFQRYCAGLALSGFKKNALRWEGRWVAVDTCVPAL